MKGTFMQKKNILLGAIIALLAATAVTSTAVAFRLNNELKRLEKDKIAPIDKGSVPTNAVVVAENARGSVPTNEVVRTERHEMAVEKVEYDGQNRLEVFLSERPDMDVARAYVTVEPLQKGELSFTYETPWNYRKQSTVPCLVVTGDF